MKTCTICKQYKQNGCFSISKTRVDGLSNHCKNCKRSASKKYYQNSKSKVLEDCKANKKSRAEKSKKYYKEHKKVGSDKKQIDDYWNRTKDIYY